MNGFKMYFVCVLTFTFCCCMVPFLLSPKNNVDMIISVKKDDVIETYPIEEYVQGVLNAELPKEFHPEAMKAQAVAARTYALKTAQSQKHDTFDICASSQCCQGFRPDLQTNSGQNKRHLAVEATKGEVLMYGDRLIEAAYFACSGGKTEDASAVWGNEFPYLIAQDSPENEKAEYYEKNFVFAKEQVAQLLSIPAENELTVSEICYSPGNGIDSVFISGVHFTGSELRRNLSLPSTYMEISVENNFLIIHTKGYGHRVGLSQLGAETMARSGADYKHILLYYYPNTEIVTIEKIH